MVVIIFNLFTIEKTELGVLEVRKFGKDEIVGFYYGFLINSFLSGELQKKKTYGYGCKGSTVDCYLIWYMK